MHRNILTPGLAPGMTNDAYQAADARSKSELDLIAPPSSPLHYYAKRIDPKREPEKRTEALILGDAIHKAILEPDLVSQHFVAVPDDAPRRPSITQVNAKNPSPESRGSINYWRDFEAENVGKFILKPAEMKTVLACRDAVHRHPVARGLFVGGEAEQSYFAIDPETGEPIKCRLDYSLLEAEAMIVDLKTTEDASEFAFGHSARKYRYDGQAVWYPDVLAAAYGQPVAETFVFVAVEKDPPHAIGIYYYDYELGILGARRSGKEVRAELRRDLKTIIKCREENFWPDYGVEVKPLSVRRNA